MRKLLLIIMLSFSLSVNAEFDYDSNVEISIDTLGLTKQEISQAAEAALKHYRWSVLDKTDTSIKANYRGQTPLVVDFTGDQKVVIGFEKKKNTSYKNNARLRRLKKLSLVNLTDCSAKSARELDAETKTRRNYVYALTKAGWGIKKLTPEKMTAISPGNGRVEVTISSDGLFKLIRWDEIESEYTDPARDRYVSKVQSAYDRQLGRCSK